MTQLILKNEVEQSKIDSLLLYIKSLNIEVELYKNNANFNKEKKEFSLNRGMWKDNFIDSKTLRQQAWSR